MSVPGRDTKSATQGPLSPLNPGGIARICPDPVVWGPYTPNQTSRVGVTQVANTQRQMFRRRRRHQKYGSAACAACFNLCTVAIVCIKGRFSNFSLMVFEFVFFTVCFLEVYHSDLF